MADLICTGASVICNDAQTAVNQMDSVFQGLPQGLQNQFQSAHDAIMGQFNTQWANWQASWLPVFNPICCTLQTIGDQATALANNMLAASGQSGLPTPPAQPDYIGELATIAVIVAVGYIAYESGFFDKHIQHVRKAFA